MSVSNFTSATFAVAKKYTQLVCIFGSKISHCQNTLKFTCKTSACKSSCKNLREFFCVDFSCKSATLHAIYVRVSAAMPVACTVVHSSLLAWISLVHKDKVFAWLSFRKIYVLKASFSKNFKQITDINFLLTKS